MEDHFLYYLILFFFTILSAFFSGSETALFSLNKTDLHRFSESEKNIEKSISDSMRTPQNILITILIGNLFVNVIVSSISTTVLLDYFKESGHFISIGVVTPLMILFCEISPKIISLNSYRSISVKIFPLLNFFHKLFFPIRKLLLFVSDFVVWIFNLNVAPKNLTEDELNQAVDIGEEEGFIDKQEVMFLKNVLRFTKKDAENVMLPRNKTLFISEHATISEAMNLFINSNQVKAPVYTGDFDHVVGLLDSRDLLKYHLGYKKGKFIKKYIREIDFFPSSIDLNELLKLFLSKKIEMAVVVDEFGGTGGIVTLDGILSALIGKDFSKDKEKIENEKNKNYNSKMVINGLMQIDDFNLNFEANLDSSYSETIAGYIIEKMGSFPKVGDFIQEDDFVFKVKKVKNNAILLIDIEKREGIK